MINALTATTGIFAFPSGHTLSPAMHNAAFQHLKIDAAYLSFEVKPENLSAAVHAIRALGLLGVNITIPHKERVMPYLDTIDRLAKRIGSVNTIVNKNGVLSGYSTDGPGFIEDLTAHRFDPRGATAIVVGSGGAGRWRGGDGARRRIRFLAPMTAVIVSSRRIVAPFGLG